VFNSVLANQPRNNRAGRRNLAVEHIGIEIDPFWSANGAGNPIHCYSRKGLVAVDLR
jgi:hypothetical protein